MKTNNTETIKNLINSQFSGLGAGLDPDGPLKARLKQKINRDRYEFLMQKKANKVTRRIEEAP